MTDRLTFEAELVPMGDESGWLCVRIPSDVVGAVGDGARLSSRVR